MNRLRSKKRFAVAAALIGATLALLPAAEASATTTAITSYTNLRNITIAYPTVYYHAASGKEYMTHMAYSCDGVNLALGLRNIATGSQVTLSGLVFAPQAAATYFLMTNRSTTIPAANYGLNGRGEPLFDDCEDGDDITWTASYTY